MTDLSIEDVTAIKEPPRLARYSHRGGSGAACIMNLMCWVKGVADPFITDAPPGYNIRLRQLLIEANDVMCSHLTVDINTEQIIYQGEEFTQSRNRLFNCPECSQVLIDAAFAMADSAWLYPYNDESHYYFTSRNYEGPLTAEERGRLERLVNDATTQLRSGGAISNAICIEAPSGLEVVCDRCWTSDYLNKDSYEEAWCSNCVTTPTLGYLAVRTDGDDNTIVYHCPEGSPIQVVLAARRELFVSALNKVVDYYGELLDKYHPAPMPEFGFQRTISQAIEAHALPV